MHIHMHTHMLRFHFFRRYRLRGVQNVVYYALPEHAHFYSEFVNMIGGGDGGDNGGASLVATESTAVVTSLFTRYDAMRLERVVGTKRVERMVKGAKAVYMFA